MIKTAIITGSSSGIGEATARRFSEDGYNVVLNSRSRKNLEKVANDLPETRTLIVEGDVSKQEDVERLVSETVDKFGGIDVLINNAGIALMGQLADVSREDFQNLMDINVTGMFALSQAALPYLKDGGGAIINTSSVSGIGGDWGAFAYNTSKGAVSNMTRALALDLAPDIRVNAVAPSLTITDMTDGMMENKSLVDAFERRIPMGRAAKPEEIASVIAFLAGPDASFVNGVVLPVDGGVNASNGQPDFSG